jgi:hypothetical protein
MTVAEQRERLIRPIPANAKPSAYSLALNFLPLVNLLAGAAGVYCIDGLGARLGFAAAWIYLLPPLAGRAAMWLFGQPQNGSVTQDERAYKVWWFLAQLQVPFNRFPVFEELLRLAPGLYALWLSAWGGQASPVVYWGAGALVVDRQSVRVGRGAVIGLRAVLSGHLAIKDESGAFRVALGAVEIGESALIGAYAGIGPGCTVDAGEEVPAATFLRPFSRWSGGRRVKADREGSA